LEFKNSALEVRVDAPGALKNYIFIHLEQHKCKKEIYYAFLYFGSVE
jgi:hypothetical protein